MCASLFNLNFIEQHKATGTDIKILMVYMAVGLYHEAVDLLENGK
jgi:hypothetical protein